MAKLEWSLEMECEVIDFIRDRPFIWNPLNTDYKKTSMRKTAYKLFAEKPRPEMDFRLTADQVKDKVSSLKKRYEKELQILNSMRSSAPGAPIRSEWEHFDRLSFLSQTNTELPASPGTVPIVTEGEPACSLTESDLSELGNSVHLLSISENNEDKSEAEQSFPRSSSTVTEDSFLSAEAKKNKLKLKSSQNVDDEEDHFGRFVACRMRKMTNEKEKEEARLKILEILNRYSSPENMK